MSKKKSIISYAGLASVILAAVAVCMIFLPAISYAKANGEAVNYTGLQVTFGFSETQASLGSASYVTEWFKFSFMNLLTYVLLIVGIVFAVMQMNKKQSKLFTLITAACFVVGGVFMFMVVNYSIVGAGQVTGATLLDKQNMSLGIGAIIGGAAACLAGACKVGEFFLG